MFDLTTYIVYVLLLLSLIGLLYSASLVKSSRPDGFEHLPNHNLNLFQWLALALISIVVGYRYNVGNDWGAYVEFFQNLKVFTFDSANQGNFEVGFFLLSYLLAKLGLAYSSMFLIIAAITWVFIFKSIDIKVVPLLVLFIFLDEYFFWSMNVIRQFLSMAIFIYAIQFIVKRELWKYLGFIALSILFHTSAVILIPLYWVPWNKLYKPKLWFVLYVVTLFLSNTSIINDLMLKIIYSLGEVIPLLNVYLSYFGTDKLLAAKITIGLGYLFKIVVGLFIFYYCEKVTTKYPSTKVYFVLFFVGAIVFNLFYMIHLIVRINHYFILLRSVVLSFIIYHLWNYHKNKLIVGAFTALYFMLFLMAIYNSSNMSSPYRFVIP